MLVRLWLAAVLTVLSFQAVPTECQSTQEEPVPLVAPVLNSTTNIESAVTNNNVTNTVLVSGTNVSGPPPSSSWSRLLRKFFDRPSSQQKHADKNRIILENLNSIQANPETANRTSNVAFHDEETVAIITYINNNVNSCKLMEVK